MLNTNPKEHFMRITHTLMIVGLLLLCPAALAAHEGHKENSSAKTVVGEVIDPVCYLSHDSRGLEHAACARMCANNGVGLGILQDKTGTIYVSLPVDHSNPNAKLLEFVGQHVEVKGTVFRKGGLTGISVDSVRAVEASAGHK
jgi:hypothetical protein